MSGSFKRLLALTAVASAVAALALPANAAPGRGPSCGSAIAKPSGSLWKCTFADDFNGSSLDSGKWIAQQTATSGYGVGGECFDPGSKNVSVANGVLSLTARKETKPFTCSSPLGNFVTSYTSGMVSTWGRFSQAYGRYEVRAKFPAAKVAGLQSALWLWPVDATKYGNWPTSGEIDIAEAFSQYPDRVIPYVHYDAVLPATATNNYCMINNVSAFHTYVAEWTPTTITIKYDGATCLVHTISPLAPLTGSAPFDSPFIIALTQALGTGANALTAATPLPATTQVDYVRAWS